MAKKPKREVPEKLVELIVEQLGVAKEQVTEDATFDSFGADSLDKVELVMELEEEFEMLVPDDEAEKLKTVGDAMDYIEANRGKAPPEEKQA